MEIILFTTGMIIGSAITFFVMKKFAQKQAETASETYKDIYEKMQLQFENLSNKIFKETTQDFSNMSKERMNEILEPFKEKFEELKKQSTYNIEQGAKLDMHIKEVIETGVKISNDTNTLASALKGDNMKQGRWGEIILPSSGRTTPPKGRNAGAWAARAALPATTAATGPSTTN